MTPTVQSFPDGIAIMGDSTSQEVTSLVREHTDLLPLVIIDPPYGNIVRCDWDKTDDKDVDFASWMFDWTNSWSDLTLEGGAMYVWGGIGRPGFRPFFRYLADIEVKSSLKLANLITWKKRRGYGVQHNYLFTREECAYLIKGDPKRPRLFNVPLLDDVRGYAGYNKKYPAKSDRYRRTNVWTDVTELMRGKVHPTQKRQRLHEIMIEVHTKPDEWVADPFAGCGTTAFACRRLGRRFVVIERDANHFDALTDRLRVNRPAER